MLIINKKRTNPVRVLLLLFLCVLLFLPLFTFAEEITYLTKGGLPGIEEGTTNFSGFINSMFNLGIAVAAVLAVVMITVGGLEYMTTDSVYNKTSGRDRIQNAVVGLLIALLIWLILNTINPNLLKFDLKIAGVGGDQEKIEGPGFTPDTSNKGGSGFSETSKRAESRKKVEQEAAINAETLKENALKDCNSNKDCIADTNVKIKKCDFAKDVPQAYEGCLRRDVGL